MSSKKLCPHCLKVIPWKHRFKSKCPHCFRPLRRKSESERGTLLLWFEDRGKWWWFFILLVVSVVGAMIGQLAGRHSSFLNFISAHPIMFALTLYYLAAFASIISRIYVPLMLGAPRILRRERPQITQYKIFTVIGMVLGLGLALFVIGADQFFVMFPASVLLFTLPIAILWAYLALVLQEPDYEDERVWSFLTEIGAGERLDHRHHGYYVLIMVPVAALIFYWMMQNQWLYYWFADSTLVSMFKELYMRATGRAG
ncbi:hypothetical protein HUU59_06140 [bacterium]|nr:hypothetical protein [bacterium]